MNVSCPKCQSRYNVPDENGGRQAYCHKCSSNFILPIRDPKQLLAWATNAPWHRVQRFIQNSAAKGHSRDTIDDLIRIFEQRRWTEEGTARYELAKEKGTKVLTYQEKVWARSETFLSQRKTIEDIRRLTPEEFEELVAQLFGVQGYNAKAVGQTADSGVDVSIRDKEGKLWAVAQCKRYAGRCSVTASQVRDFAGAFLLSGATCGFIFTTGRLTAQAMKHAAALNWLKVLNGTELVKYMENVNTTASDQT